MLEELFILQSPGMSFAQSLLENLAQFLACTLLPALLYKFIFHPTFSSPLSKIPSAHFTSPFSNGWIQWQRYCGKENRAIHDAHERLGPIVRLGSTELSINSVEGLRIIYSDSFNKHEWYSRSFDNYEYAHLSGCSFSSAWRTLTWSKNTQHVFHD